MMRVINLNKDGNMIIPPTEPNRQRLVIHVPEMEMDIYAMEFSCDAKQREIVVILRHLASEIEKGE